MSKLCGPLSVIVVIIVQAHVTQIRSPPPQIINTYINVMWQTVEMSVLNAAPNDFKCEHVSGLQKHYQLSWRLGWSVFKSEHAVLSADIFLRHIMTAAKIEISQPHGTDHHFYMNPPSLQLSAIRDCTPGWENPRENCCCTLGLPASCFNSILFNIQHVINSYCWTPVLSRYLPSVSSVWLTDAAPVDAFANEESSYRDPFVFTSAKHSSVVGSHVKTPWSGGGHVRNPE